MADLARNTIPLTAPRGGRDAIAGATGVQFYAGALVGINAAGYVAKWADTAGHRFLGIVLEDVLGDNVKTVKVDTSGRTLIRATVALLTRADVNARVHCTTDNPADLTLVAGANVQGIGWVKEFISAGVGVVELFTPAEYQGLI